MTLQDLYTQLAEQEALLVQHLNASSGTPVPPKVISDVCMKLAILNGLLGSYIPALKQKQLEVERQIMLDYAAADPSARGSTTMAIQRARTDSAKERYAYELAEAKHKALWKIISMAQSHLRALGEELKS